MLKKIHRISKTKDFQTIKRKGKSFFSGNIVMRCVRTRDPIARFGFIVSNKVSKKATVRNKLRRQLSEVVRKRLVEIKPDIDCVIMVRPGVKGYDFAEIEKNIEVIFNRSRIEK